MSAEKGASAVWDNWPRGDGDVGDRGESGERGGDGAVLPVSVLRNHLATSTSSARKIPRKHAACMEPACKRFTLTLLPPNTLRAGR